jgi:membrane-associated phospholipid phosphatase
MNKRAASWLGRGIFRTGWANAAIGLALAAAVFFVSKVYDLLNHGPAVLNLRTALDSALPLVPVFVIPYVSLQPYIYASLLLFLVFRTRLYQSTAIAFLIAWSLSYCFYALLQSEVVRPVLLGSGRLVDMIREVYAGDKPFNDFPSLHTSLSAILAIHWFRAGKRLGILAWVWTALIIASTVLIKQHYLADLGAGLLVAFIASWLPDRFLPRDTVQRAT